MSVEAIGCIVIGAITLVIIGFFARKDILAAWRWRFDIYTTEHRLREAEKRLRGTLRRRVMGGHKTVTAGDGYEFRITSELDNGKTAAYTRSYIARQGDILDELEFTDARTGERAIWLKPCAELVKIAQPEAETVTGPECFEFPWPSMGKKGDFVRVNDKGYWSLRRYDRAVIVPEKIQQGMAVRRPHPAI